MTDDAQIRKLQRLIGSPKAPPKSAPIQDTPSQSKLGKYDLLTQLSPRSWEAVNTKTNKRVALRLLGAIDLPAVVDQVGAELKPFSSLNHPIFINYHKLSQCDGLYFLVRNFQPGKNLETHDIAPESGLQAFYQLARALQFAHARNLFHGSLTHRNAIIDSGGRPFIVDFGIRRISRWVAKDPSRVAIPGAESDISDLGILFLTLLSGVPPAEIAASADLPPLRPINPEVDEAVHAMASRIMGNEPFNKASEMADESGRIYQMIPTEQLPEVGLLQKFEQKRSEA